MTVCEICKKKLDKAKQIEYLREKFLGKRKIKGPNPLYEERNGKLVTITG